MALVWRFTSDEDGATAIEYGLIAALLAVATITAFVTFGSSLTGLFGFVNDRAGTVINAAGLPPAED
jgi:pilus assembly protein Flp/PilA